MHDVWHRLNSKKQRATPFSYNDDRQNFQITPVVVAVDSHIEYFVLATKETTVTPHESVIDLSNANPARSPQIGTTVNGSHHSDS